MSTEEVENVHVEGPPWTIVGRFATFEKAAYKKEELSVEKNLQVKVKWSRRRDDFVVKTRVDPAAALEDEQKKRRAEKKRRKKKLNKKRRKK